MIRPLAIAAVLLASLPALARTVFADDLPAAQKQAICGSRASCTVRVENAAPSPDHPKLLVVEARFAVADKPADAPEEGCVGDPEAADAPERDGGEELWLIAGDAAPKRILALCNDGYGSAGVGEDAIKIGPNSLVWTQSGGSAWRWEVTRKIRLAPLAITSELHCSFNDVAPGTGVVTDVDAVAMRARSVGYSSAKKFSDDDGVGCPDWPTGPDSTLPTGPEMVGGYAVPMPAGNASDQAKTYPDGTVLGDCALELSTDDLHGFLVFGKPADAASAATIRVIKETEASLLIQLYDPTAAAELAASKAKSWVGQPHFEIWTSEMGNPEDNDGPNGALYVFHQFAVGLDDQVYKGNNAADPLPAVTHWAAKDEQGRAVTVYRLQWPADQYPMTYGLGVVYSQAKDGKQVRLVSNAQIKKNKPLFLPEAWPFNTDESGLPAARCTQGADKMLKVTAAAE